MENRQKLTSAVSALLATTTLIGGQQSNTFAATTTPNSSNWFTKSPKLLNKRWKLMLGFLLTGGAFGSAAGVTAWQLTKRHYKKEINKLKKNQPNNPSDVTDNGKTKDTPDKPGNGSKDTNNPNKPGNGSKDTGNPEKPYVLPQNPVGAALDNEIVALPTWSATLPEWLSSRAVNQRAIFIYKIGTNFALDEHRTTKIPIPNPASLTNQLRLLVPNIETYSELRIFVTRTAEDFLEFQIQDLANLKNTHERFVSRKIFLTNLNNGVNPADTYNNREFAPLSAWRHISQSELLAVKSLPLAPDQNVHGPVARVFYWTVNTDYLKPGNPPPFDWRGIRHEAYHFLKTNVLPVCMPNSTINLYLHNPGNNKPHILVITYRDRSGKEIRRQCVAPAYWNKLL